MRFYYKIKQVFFIVFSLTSFHVMALSAIEDPQDIPQEIAAICGDQPCSWVYSEMKRLAKNGSSQAQAVVALLSRGGFGAEQNNQQSIRYMRKAARNGLTLAMFDLARVYREGVVTDKDEEESNYWLMRAVKKGHVEATTWALKLNLLTESDVNAGLGGRRAPELSENEGLLTVRPGGVTLTELVEELKRAGFNKKSRTGTRLNGKSCKNVASPCRSVQINTPALSQEFYEFFSRHDTAPLPSFGG